MTKFNAEYPDVVGMTMGATPGPTPLIPPKVPQYNLFQSIAELGEYKREIEERNRRESWNAITALIPAARPELV